MVSKTGRNDPCPCGSGTKYKKCCANSAASNIEKDLKGHDGAVARAVGWLSKKHRKAVNIAIENMLFDGLSEEEHAVLSSLDQDTWQGIHINATEWLLAEGHIFVKDGNKRVAEYLLEPGGPLFTVDQRNWIIQLSEQPLRLYEVTEVIPGEQMTLCDVLSIKALPVVVIEKSGSNPDLIGSYVGCRIMEVEGRYELSGAVYPFSELKFQEVAEHLYAIKKQFGRKRKGLQELLGTIIRKKWLEQFYAPMQMPSMKDAYSGESMLLITDHYNVKEWNTLAKALEAQNDVEGIVKQAGVV